MASYTIEQRVQIIKVYYQNECSSVQTLRALRPFYGRRGGPSKSTLQRLAAKFETTGSVSNQPVFVRQRNARSAKNIAIVRESVHEHPMQSIPRRARQLGLSQTSIWRILRRDLDLHPYNIQLTQELKVDDHRQRRLQEKQEQKNTAAFTQRANAPIQPKKTKFTENQKIKLVITKNVNKSAKSELRGRAKDGQINLSKSQEAVARHHKSMPSTSSAASVV